MADRAETLLAETPRRALPGQDRVLATAHRLAEDGAIAAAAGETSLPGTRAPIPAERLAAALGALDLDELSPRQALQWLWRQQERLVAEATVVADNGPDAAAWD